MYTLIIAEKPSVAQAIAAVVGSKKREDGYLSGPQYLVSWCIGHLVELAPPHAYNEAYKTWRAEDLPIVPAEWKYEAHVSTEKQLNILKRLMNLPDVETIICATDAGREGELIFRLVYNYCHCHKPVKRLWISSMEESAIRDGMEHLRDDAEFDSLYEAALCRQKADWLVGMNASRLYSLLYGTTIQVGRVLTPTLALIARREEEIQTFQQEPFYTVKLRCGFDAYSERITDKDEAEALQKACHLNTAIVKSVEQKTRTEKPPKLYDLTSLQRDANRLFGYTAQQTLDCAQALYEKKLITYPRTDSRYLTHDAREFLEGFIIYLSSLFTFTAQMTLSCNNDQVIDDSQVSDHHAIIPTKSLLAENWTELPTGERDILLLIVTRLFCAVSDPFIYEETAATVTCEGHDFTGKGKYVSSTGWKAIDSAFRAFLGGRTAQEPDEPYVRMPDLSVGEERKPCIAQLNEGQTTPLKRYTEDTLLAAMEHAGANEMPDDTERKGLGTPATRAGIVEKLIEGKMVERKGSGKVKSLVPTAKGLALAKVIPDEIQSPAMTAEWEQRLKLIERGEDDPDAFMTGIISMLNRLAVNSKPITNAADLFPSGRKRIGTCPACGAPVSETSKGWFCENQTCRFGLWKDSKFFTSKGKKLTADLAAAFLKERSLEMTNLYSERTGKIYDATITLGTESDGSARFSLSFSNSKKEDA